MRGLFTMPRGTSRPHTTAQVRGAAAGCAVGRCEAACGVVSGKFLHDPVRWHATTPRRHRSDSPSARSNWHLRCSAVLRRLRVERRGGCHPVYMAMGRRQSKGLAGAVGRASMGYGGRMDSGWRAHLVLATSAGGRPGITTIEWGTVSLPASQPWTALRWARLAVFGRPRRNV
jgi:hypothetical protein